jgi:hypothetical protein
MVCPDLHCAVTLAGVFGATNAGLRWSCPEARGAEDEELPLLCASVRDCAEHEGRGNADDEVGEVDEAVFPWLPRFPRSPKRLDGLFPRRDERGDSRGLPRF